MRTQQEKNKESKRNETRDDNDKSTTTKNRTAPKTIRKTQTCAKWAVGVAWEGGLGLGLGYAGWWHYHQLFWWQRLVSGSGCGLVYGDIIKIYMTMLDSLTTTATTTKRTLSLATWQLLIVMPEKPNTNPNPHPHAPTARSNGSGGEEGFAEPAEYA